jgi:hypothetical protein
LRLRVGLGMADEARASVENGLCLKFWEGYACASKLPTSSHLLLSSHERERMGGSQRSEGHGY